MQKNMELRLHMMKSNHNIRLNGLMPIIVCDQCGIMKQLPWGTDIKRYAYKKYTGVKEKYFCSWSCLRAHEKGIPADQATITLAKKKLRNGG